MAKLLHIIKVGDVFGRLTVVAKLRKGSVNYCECLCSCGQRCVVRKDGLYTGKQVSCGCYARELAQKRLTTHGEAQNRTPEYTAWSHMLRRCYTPTTEGYANWGGRGITVCDRWRTSFESFLEDMGRRPSPKHSLDRKDNEGNYTPDNCHWATPPIQLNNTRRSRKITFRGETLTVTQWRLRLGWKRGVIPYRLDAGWAVERALTEPPHAAR